MHIDKKTIRNIFLGVISCIILYWILHETERVRVVWNVFVKMVSPFFFGGAFAFVLNVPMRAIENRLLVNIKNAKLKRGLSLLIAIILLLLILMAVVLLLIPQIIDTIESILLQIPVFYDRLVLTVRGFLNNYPDVWEWLSANIDFESMNFGSILEKILSIVGNSATQIFTGAVSAIGTVSSGIVNFVLGFFFSIYCLLRKEILVVHGKKLLYAFLPEETADSWIRVLQLSNTTFSNFISGQCLEAVILGCMFAVAMLIFGMPYIPLISVLIAVTALIPIVGAFAGCILGAFFILVNDPIQAGWFVVMFLVIQQIEGNLIYPRVVGTSIGLPGMWVLVAVAVGGELMGPVGMLLMIPLASVGYALLREHCNKTIKDKNISDEKLAVQPPVLRKRLKEHLEKHKSRFFKKKSEKNDSEKTKE